MSKVLEEDYDEDYEPTAEEIEEYAQFLGMNPKTEKHLLWIARESLKAKLPPDWKPCQTDDGNIYYFNFKTGESSWDHPCDEYYKQLYNKILKEGDPKGDIRATEEQKRKAAAAVKTPSLSHSIAPRIPDTKSSESASSKSPTRPESKKSPPKLLKKIDSMDEFELSDSSGEKAKNVKPLLKPMEAPKTLPSLKMTGIPKIDAKPIIDDVDDFDSDDVLKKPSPKPSSNLSSVKSPIEKKSVEQTAGSSTFMKGSIPNNQKLGALDQKNKTDDKNQPLTSLTTKIVQSKADEIEDFDFTSESSRKVSSGIVDLKPLLNPVHKKEPQLDKQADFPMMSKHQSGFDEAKTKIDAEQEKMKKEYEEKKLQELFEFEKDQQRHLELKKEQLIAQYNRKLDHLRDEQDLDFTRKQTEVLNSCKTKFNGFNTKFNLLFDSIIDELKNAPIKFSMDSCDIQLKPVQTEYASADKLIHELQTTFVNDAKQKYSSTSAKLKEKATLALQEFETQETHNLEILKEKNRKSASSLISQNSELKIYRALLSNDGSDGCMPTNVGDLILCESDISSSSFSGYNLNTLKEGKVSLNIVEFADLKQDAREQAQKQAKEEKSKDIQVELALEDRKLQEKRREYYIKYSELDREYEEKLKRYDQDVLDLQKEQAEKYNSTKQMWDRRLHDLEMSYQEKLEDVKKNQEIVREEIQEIQYKNTPKIERDNLSSYRDEHSHSYYKGKPLLSFNPDDFDLTNDKHLDFSSSSSFSEFEHFSKALMMEGKSIKKTKDYLNKQKQDIANVLADTSFDDPYKDMLGIGLKRDYEHPSVININTPLQPSPVVKSEMQYPDINVNLHQHQSPEYRARNQVELNQKSMRTEIDSRVEKQNSYLQQIEDELNQLTQVLKQRAIPIEPPKYKPYTTTSIRNKRGTESTWKKEQKRTEAVVNEHQDWLNKLPNKLIL
ncbi:hypothetical protein HDV06_005619 [Boothiomyces sp. JEL0866]|nr:hypothetical protein HDV06_005619 [Boothiomyces sp. JEL0866]